MLTYGTTKLSIIRAECIAFPVSPKNSATSVAHLINKTGSRHVFVTQYLKPLVDAATIILKKQVPVVLLMPTFKDLFVGGDSENFGRLGPRLVSTIMIMIHSWQS